MNMRRRGVRFPPDRQFHRRARLAAVIAGLSAMLTMAAPAQSTAARLRHLGGVDELKAWFNAGKGQPRLILLLSPT
jgi:hypothetical protein